MFLLRFSISKASSVKKVFDKPTMRLSALESLHTLHSQNFAIAYFSACQGPVYQMIPLDDGQNLRWVSAILF